ncbi:MAG TPA: helix-turn-helix transcriptional regulator [Ktedonobacteraceae bacterium]|nr:helix-turn-helix transcriptional regulator [Ktedonobacteraceae bacterium]
MRYFGAFLANLRSSANLSLEELAKLVDTSRSTLSRIENNDVPQPFKGSIRKLLICIAELLCTSRTEIERYLNLAGIDRALLTEVEEIQLGFLPRVPRNTPEEASTLEHLERIYTQLLRNLEKKEIELGVGNAPPTVKLKTQEYRNTLQEIQRRLNKLYNRVDADLMDTHPVQEAPVYYAERIGERIVVGSQYGENQEALLKASSLYDLASDNARWLMHLANVERFAIDDCIILVNSENFKGWEPHEIRTTILTKPLPIPDDLATIQKEKLPSVEKHYFNAPHYRLVSCTPAFLEHLRDNYVLAPLDFYDYFSLNPYFDEPLLTALDGSKISIRQKYGNTALTYSSTDKGTSLIPAPISIQGVVITEDEEILLMQRSLFVAFYPYHWSASFEVTMNAPGFANNRVQKGDANFFAGATRGIEEEFAVSEDEVESVRVLSLNVEYLTLSIDVITLIKLSITAEEIRQRWLLKAAHREEASRLATISTDLESVIDKIFSKTLWHPTSRMRLAQFLFHRYGIDAVSQAIKARKQAQERIR